MLLRDAFEVFCQRGSTTYRGVARRTVGGMDGKSWRKMLQDSKVYKTPKALAQGVLIFSEICQGQRIMDFQGFEVAIAKVGERKGMTGSDIGAYLSHMAEQFHTATGGSMPSRDPLTKDQMKEAIKKRASEKSDKIPPPPPPPLKAEKVKTTKPAPAPGSAESGAAAAATTTQSKKKDSGPEPPNLKEIARQNQLLDAQKAALAELNRSLASGIPYEDPPVVAQKKSKRNVTRGAGAAADATEAAAAAAATTAGATETCSANAANTVNAANAANAANRAFSWEAKEKVTIKLRENPSSWDWASVEGQDKEARRKRK